MATSASPPPTPSSAPSSATSKVFLLVAVLLALLATVLAFFLISSVSGVANEGAPIKIVVAKTNLAPNQPIDPERDLTTIEYPRKYAGLANRGLQWDARANYKGLRVNREIIKDQPILLADLVETDFLTLEPPYYALAIPAEPGMIIPGDLVKIIVTRPNLASAAASMPIAGASTYEAQIIGKDPGFKVLAVGANLFRSRQQVLFLDPTNSSNAVNNKTVTLAVTEEQAREIMAALGPSGSAKATLLLCPSDKTKAPQPEDTPDTAPAPTRPAASRPG